VTQPLPEPSRIQPQPALDRPGVPSAKPARAGRGNLLAIVAIAAIAAVAVAALVMSGIALARHPGPSPLTSSPAPGATAPSSGDVAAAKKAACDAWNAASAAMVAARQPFVDSPPNWNDPTTVRALVQAQAGILIQVEYLRQHVSAETPAEVAGPIDDYIRASIDLAALDGQHQPAAVANAAADRGVAAAAKVRAACGM
jgi:hypothetical protein